EAAGDAHVAGPVGADRGGRARGPAGERAGGGGRQPRRDAAGGRAGGGAGGGTLPGLGSLHGGGGGAGAGGEGRPERADGALRDTREPGRAGHQRVLPDAGGRREAEAGRRLRAGGKVSGGADGTLRLRDGTGPSRSGQRGGAPGKRVRGSG